MPEPRTSNRLVAALRRMGDRAFERLPRFDAWKNAATGMGEEGYDKTLYGRVVHSPVLDDETLSALFHADDIAERAISIVPQEMLREPFDVGTGDPGLDGSIVDKFDAIDLRGSLVEAIRWARCFGGSAIMLGADDGRDAALPLIPERAKDLSYLRVVDRRLLWPVSYYSQTDHPRFGEPETYAVTVQGGSTYDMRTVHESRLVLFRGAPTGIRERAQNRGWDLSYLQRIFDVLRAFHTSWKAAETLLSDGNQAIFKMSGLEEYVGAQGQATLQARMQLTNLYRSVMRALIIDADKNESFERQAVSLTDVPQMLQQTMLRLAAAVHIPVTILMGQSPAGMNATGDSDFRWFYSRIRSEQNTMLAPKIRRITSIWLRSKAGPKTQPKALSVAFTQLWTETPLNEAMRQKTIAERDAAYVGTQVFLPDEVALHRGRPGGFADDIVLTPEGIKARQAALKSDLDKLAAGTLEPETDPNAGFSGGEPAGRFDASGARLFDLFRHEDETGVSGTGVIAEGIVFDDGSVVLRWKTATASTTFFANVEDMLKVHGHAGKTELRYIEAKQ